MAGVHADEVLVRGKIVDISLAAINHFYALPDITENEFSTIMHTSPGFQEISQLLTRGDIGLLLNWRKILRGQLTLEAKSWSYFGGACLKPVISHSIIQRWRTMLTYAILMYLTIDVGKIINREMKTAADVGSNRALSFTVLICQLCHLARVNITCSDPADCISLQLIIKKQMYAHEEKSKRGQRQAASDDEEDAHGMEHNQSYGHEHEDRASVC